MNNKLDGIFEIASFYDRCRWSNAGNYNLINLYKDDLDDETKLLTHWLCYIADRQMGFTRIWDVGGFVFSELADHYKKNGDLSALLYPKSDSAFIQKDKDEEKYSFIGKAMPNELIREKYPKSIENDRVVFKSRYLPSDYFSILYTLDILNCDEYQQSLSCFIAKVYDIHQNDTEHLIQKILFSLSLLSYDDMEQKNYLNIRDVRINNIHKRTEKVKAVLNHKKKFDDRFQLFLQKGIYQHKRAWCSLRDYLKSPEFNGYFKNAMKKYLSEDAIGGLTDESMLHYLELPGDVWNNNSIFRKCVFKGTEYADSKESFNVLLRGYHNKNSEMKAYPEQFDISFDFVPRMCDKNNCDICPIGCLSDEENKGRNFEKTCINDASKYCIVALVGCGYKVPCCGQKKCELVKLVRK